MSTIVCLLAGRFLTQGNEERVLRPQKNYDTIDKMSNGHDKGVIAGANKNDKGKSSSSTDIQVDVAEEVAEEDVQIEVAPIVMVKDPAGPTPEEKALHDLLHLPHRSWCPICVKARGKEDSHFRKKSNKPIQDKPVISFDYKSFGQEIDRDDKLTAVIVRDITKTIYAHICHSKGGSDEWVVNRIMQDIDELGHNDVILKCDGENSIVHLLKKVKEKRVGNTIIEHPPAYDPQSNGVAEKAVQEFMEQLRATKFALEQRLKCNLSTDDPIMLWASDHAATVLSRYKLSMDGKTPYRRLMGKDCRAPILEFGEKVLAKPMRTPKSRRKLSLKSRWIEGVWVGSTRHSKEHLVAIDNGGPVIKVRTVKRRLEVDRWNIESIKAIKATPRFPNPKDEAQFGPMAVRDTTGADNEASFEMLPNVPVADQVLGRRDFKITKTILTKFGITEDCPGCQARDSGMRRSHTPACRIRLEEKMNSDNWYENRLKTRDTRLERCHYAEATEHEGDAKVAEPDEDVVSSDEEMPDDQDADLVPDDHYVNQEERIPRIRNRGEEDIPEEMSEPPSPRKRQRLQKVKMNRSIMNVCNSRNLRSEHAKISEMVYDLDDGNRIDIENQSAKRKEFYCTRVMAALMKEENSHPHDESEEAWWQDLYRGIEFYDDVNEGQKLEWSLVVKARRLEIEYFRKMGVYTKISKYETNGKVITTRWIDTNKGDEKLPDYRSRLVGREIKTDNRLDLFAATPPLETLKILVSKCARGQNRKDPLRMATIDIRRAYFYAPAVREVYIKIPKEDMEEGDEDRVAKLNLSLYGTRDAAQNWTITYTKFLLSLGFVKGSASPCNFWHQAKDVSLTVHGDDFLIVAPSSSLKWLKYSMESKFEIKYKEI